MPDKCLSIKIDFRCSLLNSVILLAQINSEKSCFVIHKFSRRKGRRLRDTVYEPKYRILTQFYADPDYKDANRIDRSEENASWQVARSPVVKLLLQFLAIDLETPYCRLTDGEGCSDETRIS